jgi:diguanylate cyclase (GGDEF)-like protein
MEPVTSLVKLLVGHPEALQGRWEGSVRDLTNRVGPLFLQPGVFEEVRGLLLDLVSLLERSGSVEQAVAAEFEPILEHLRTLQTKHDLNPADMVLLLFSMRDVLKDAVNEAAGSDKASLQGSTHVHVVDQVGTLLNRLGLVSFETSMRARDDENAQQDVLAIEYALLYERTRQMAITDPLTGLHNFGYFRDRLREERVRAERYQRLLSLVLFDLDHFKRYNDINGHPAGNDVLRRVSAILREECRETDLVARYGGEEMVILMPEASRRTAWEVAERIRRRLSADVFPYRGKPEGGQVTLSAGVATFPVDAANEEELVSRADKSLYQAKNNGRNQVVSYEPPHKVRVTYRPEPWVTDVALVGSFNNWDKDNDAMEREADGSFAFVLALNPGLYSYKFVLNGTQWINDPLATETQPDNLGGHNSVLRVTPETPTTLP